MRADEAAPVRRRRSPTRATNAGRAIAPGAAAVSKPSSASILTSYLRYNGVRGYCSTHY
jgi:hypothetical protein